MRLPAIDEAQRFRELSESGLCCSEDVEASKSTLEDVPVNSKDEGGAEGMGARATDEKSGIRPGCCACSIPDNEAEGVWPEPFA